jgi:magnesium-transporting ATPase (P-type)
MVPENVIALRDGKKTTVAGAKLVPGDGVLLASGDKVPADMRLAPVRTLKMMRICAWQSGKASYIRASSIP